MNNNKITIKKRKGILYFYENEILVYGIGIQECYQKIKEVVK